MISYGWKLLFVLVKEFDKVTSNLQKKKKKKGLQIWKRGITSSGFTTFAITMCKVKRYV